jgi:hypothetical protein
MIALFVVVEVFGPGFAWYFPRKSKEVVEERKRSSH